jgi:hypothetical protein
VVLGWTMQTTLAALPFFAQQAVHGAGRAQVLTTLEQSHVDLQRRFIKKHFTIQYLHYRLALLCRKRTRL